MEKIELANQKLLDAARLGEEQGVEMALALGANVDALADGGWSGWTASMLAAAYGHKACLRLLISGGADIEAKSPGGWTASMLAAGNGHPSLASLIEGIIMSRSEGAELGGAVSNHGRQSQRMRV